MKQITKIFSIALLIISSAAIASDHDRQPAQAELDALQFAKEQETKKLHEKSNAAKTQDQNQKIHDGLKELLNGTKIKGEDFKVDLVDRLPSDIQTHIAKMIYSGAFTNGYQLLPALIPYCQLARRPRPAENSEAPGSVRYKRNFTVSGVQHENRYQIKHSVKDRNTEGQNFIIDFAPAVISVSHDNSKPLETCSVSGTIINDTLYLDRGPAKEMLRNCTPEQLRLLHMLWELNRKASPDQEIYLGVRDTNIYNSLPLQMRNNLEKNYRILTFHEAKRIRTCRRVCTCSGLLIGVGLLIAEILWLQIQ